MGLFSNLLQTYDKCRDAVGIVQYDKNGEEDEKKTLLPIFHTTFKSKIHITLDGEGNLRFVSPRDKKDITIIIPCTDESEGRSGTKIFAHPLCDKLEYLSTLGNDNRKVNNYIEQLGNWKNYTQGIVKEKLNAVYTYVSKGTIISDLKNKNIIIDKSLGVRFSVQIKDDEFENIWEDKLLRKSWIDFVKSNFIAPTKNEFDYISGKKIESIARNHPKKIIPQESGAKLISCNDKGADKKNSLGKLGLTAGGRFATQDEVQLIDIISSQEAHQALRWLINNSDVHTDTQVIVIWAVDSDTKEEILPFYNSYDLVEDQPAVKLDSEILHEASDQVDQNYAKLVAKTLRGFSPADKIKEHYKKIVVAILDAATTGRMGVTFYQEIPRNEYLENIAKWHEDSAWHLVTFKKETNEKGKEQDKRIDYIGCPSFKDIIFAAYGKPRSGNDENFKKIKKKIEKQLIECMFGNFPFPKSFVDMAAIRASHPLSFTDGKGKFSESDWERALKISCSLTKKYIKQKYKEEILMELEEKRQDRDYLFGRLLAVADKMESVALYKQDKSNQRATNAVRLMSSFAVKPFSTWLVLYNQLLPYRNQLQGAGYYQSIIDSIMVLFKSGDYEENNNKPLSALYLLGYSAQNRTLNNKNKNKEEN